MCEDRPHASAGCRADYARTGIRRIRRQRRARLCRPRGLVPAASRIERARRQSEPALNAGDYTVRAIERLAEYTGLPVRPAANLFRVTQSMGDVLAFSSALRRLAVEVNKLASDLRLLSSGPRAGLAEVRLPPVQPGSSIMPGKVNPSVPEMVNQVCFQVYGCDTAVLAASDAGQLELNVMMPVIAWNAIHATRILTNAMTVLLDRCIAGIAPTWSSAGRCSIAARPGHRAEPYIDTPQRPTSPRHPSKQAGPFVTSCANGVSSLTVSSTKFFRPRP